MMPPIVFDRDDGSATEWAVIALIVVSPDREP
jgi:hypothetical protein